MDPEATWEELTECAECGDLEQAAEAAEALARWIERGGFRPKCIPTEFWSANALNEYAAISRGLADRGRVWDPMKGHQ